MFWKLHPCTLFSYFRKNSHILQFTFENYLFLVRTAFQISMYLINSFLFFETNNLWGIYNLILSMAVRFQTKFLLLHLFKFMNAEVHFKFFFQVFSFPDEFAIFDILFSETYSCWKIFRSIFLLLKVCVKLKKFLKNKENDSLRS